MILALLVTAWDRALVALDAARRRRAGLDAHAGDIDRILDLANDDQPCGCETCQGRRS